MGRLDGKVAVITGAASGFGEGMAKRFAEEGARVVVADLNAKGAERVAGEIGAGAIAVTAQPFEALYQVRPGRGRSAAVEAVVMIEPPPCACISGTTQRVEW